MIKSLKEEMIYLKNVTSDYLIKKLEEGKNLNIALFSHNAYWPAIEKLDNHFENCNVIVFGQAIHNVKRADIDIRNQFDNSDIIAFYSSDFYNEGKISELKDMAAKISDEKEKRVSIGYSYLVPFEQRIDEEISEEIEIISFKNGDETIEKVQPTEYSTVYDLIEVTLFKADSDEKNKQYKLKNNSRL